MAAAGTIFLVAVLACKIAFNADAIDDTFRTVVYSSTSDLARMCYNTYHPGCQVQQGICYNKGNCPERSKESTTCICGPECSCCVPMTFQDVVLQYIREIKYDIDKISKDIYNISEAIHGSQPSDCKDTYDWCTTVPQSYCIQSHLSEVCPKHCKKCGNSTGTAPTISATTTTAITTTATTTTATTTPKPTTTVSSTACQCGLPNSNNAKQKYPWVAGLLTADYFVRCGGSIINDRWILTAAYCIINQRTCKLEEESIAYQVTVGEHLVPIKHPSDTIKYYWIKSFIHHPEYTNCKSWHWNMALLELTEPILFNDFVRPICLPRDDSKTYAGQTATVSSWGKTSINEKLYNYLKEEQVTIRDQNECKRRFPPEWYFLMCADTQIVNHECYRDFGNPMVVFESNKYVQVGVVTYGSSCPVRKVPRVYTRVSKFISWINKTTASGKICD